jgi:hypothetical protein
MYITAVARYYELFVALRFLTEDAGHTKFK